MAIRYRDIKTLPLTQGGNYIANPVYPEVLPSPEDFYVIATAGDRYDTLALQFYNDVSLWWIIAAANTGFKGALTITPGVQLRIPTNQEQIIQLYEQVNRNR